ncbi:MAG: Holliday junction resolvase RuvX [Rhodothermales bacterium]
MNTQYPRLIGIDYGTKRVGIAVSDPLRVFAQAEGTYTVEAAFARLVEMHAEPGFDTVVVGWPLTPDGEEGRAIERVRPFVNRIRTAFPSVTVETWDERYSSERAVEALVDAGVRRKDRREKGRVDAAAAAVILQEYIDEGPPSPHFLS